MALKKLKGELAGIIKSLDTTQKIAKTGKNLRGKGQTKDLNGKRYLSELYSRRNGLKIGLI